ncbi:MAG TPA: transposase [Allosphingosinicella sp.]|nr:transposase [Allosphingosinicella sp.]
MPRVIPTAGSDSLEMGDLVEALEGGGFDPGDEDSMAEFAPHLRKLCNNRHFLGDIVIEELKRQCAGQVARNQYGPQVVLLHGTSRKFLIRANFWPAAEDSVVVNSGSQPFFYAVPHDHNFSFLTVGYLGPGYWSDYYEYDYASVVGHPGEKVALRFVERSRLSPGKVMLYRRHIDVHSQLHPDALSVSLNILATSPTTDLRDQYSFDLKRSEVRAIINPGGLATLVRLAAAAAGEEGIALAEEVSQCHPSERMRFAGLQALAATRADSESRRALFEEAAARETGLLAALARDAALSVAEHAPADTPG